MTNTEYTFVVDKNNSERNDLTLPSNSLIQANAQHRADWTILPTPNHQFQFDTTMTLVFEDFLLLLSSSYRSHYTTNISPSIFLFNASVSTD